MAQLPIQYPKVLTNTSWQSNKGRIAKMATGSDGTGLGKMLNELEAAHKKIVWSNFDFSFAIKGQAVNYTTADIDTYKKIVVSEINNALSARKQAVAVEKAAEKLAAEWSNSKLIPKSSAAAAKEIATEAKALSYAMAEATLKEHASKEIDRVNASMQKRDAAAADAVKRLAGPLKRMLDDIKGGHVDLAHYPKWQSENVRSIGADLVIAKKIKPALVPLHENWKKLASDVAPPTDANQLNAKLAVFQKHGLAIEHALAG